MKPLYVLQCNYAPPRRLDKLAGNDVFCWPQKQNGRKGKLGEGGRRNDREVKEYWVGEVGRGRNYKNEIAVQVGCSIYWCLHRTAPPYLAEEFQQSSADKARQRLRSASTSSLVVRRTRLSTIGDRAFPVAAARLWNTLPHWRRQCMFSGNVWRPISSVILTQNILQCLHSVISDTIIDLYTCLLTYSIKLVTCSIMSQCAWRPTVSIDRFRPKSL